ncbi:MAG: ATP-binding protein [Prevotellaceae bacterium]|jgi:predicted AAA+ superfamily ATPase|nr:ATP-binding protein [Prevotellaceae bacterium]
MNSTLLRLNPHWSGKKYHSLQCRSAVENLKRKKDLPHIQVLTGIRRSGKSSIFRLMINDLIDGGADPKSILILNLDEPIFTFVWENVAELYKIVEAAEQITGISIKYLFLDEVQQLSGWELFVKGAYDTQRFAKIYLTGSNSDLLQNKFATLLSGRYFSNIIRPLSLKEIFTINGLTDRYAALSQRLKMLSLTEKYLQWGSFPEIALNEIENSVKTELLSSYYESIVLKDCIVYNNVRDNALFYKLLHFVLSNVAAQFRYNTLAKAVKSNEVTVRNYLNYAARSYIITDVANFSFSLKEDNRPQHKIYSIDNGLTSAVGFQFMNREGMLLENAVYNELVNSGYVDIAFVRSKEECDFVARKDGAYHAFQVCHTLTPLNRDREFAGFNVLNGILKVESKTLITYDAGETINDICVIPFWDFFGI